MKTEKITGFFKQAGSIAAGTVTTAWNGAKYATTGIGKAIANTITAKWSVIDAIFVGIWGGVKWLFHGVRPLRITAFIFIMIVGGALVYINTLGAWERTHDVGYATIIFGIEGVVLVALPIIFAVRGIFTTPVAIAIFISGIGIASFNAKPALENILTNDEGVVDPAEMIASAEKLEDEVYGFKNPDTGERMSDTGLLYQVTRQEDDASAARRENGYVTASTRVDENAAQMRLRIKDNLREAEEFRSQARDSEWASQLAIITFVVAELIRSFGLKVLVGFDPDGTGRDKKRKPRYRRKGLLRQLRDVFWRSLVGDPGYEDYWDEDGALKRSRAAAKGHETRKENEDADSRDQLRRLKVQNQLSSYIPAFRKAKSNKLKRPKYLPQATAEYYFDMVSEERMDEVLTQMVKADLISQQDHNMLMDRHPPAVIEERRGSNSVDIVTDNLNGEANV